MIEASFEKNMMTEYMIIPAKAVRDEIQYSEKDPIEGHSIYEEKILQNNSIDNFLPFQVRDMNGEKQYFYSIKGLHSIADLVVSEPKNGLKTYLLMKSVQQCIETAEEYLLEADGLYLDEHMIFYDLSHEKYYFTYLPGYKKQIRDQMTELLSWLMKHLNYEYQGDVQLIYELYRRITQGEDYAELLKSANHKKEGEDSGSADYTKPGYTKADYDNFRDQSQNRYQKQYQYYDAPAALNQVSADNEDVSPGTQQTDLRLPCAYKLDLNSIGSGVMVLSAMALAELLLAVVTFLLRSTLAIWIRRRLGLEVPVLIIPTFFFFVFIVCVVLSVLIWYKGRKITSRYSAYEMSSQNGGMNAHNAQMIGNKVIGNKENLKEGRQGYGKEAAQDNRKEDGKSDRKGDRKGEAKEEKKESRKEIRKGEKKEETEFWKEDQLIDLTRIRSNQTCVLTHVDENDDHVRECDTVLLDSHRYVDLVPCEQGECIHVGYFPFAIGKNRKIVQYCIESEVISRRHIQFTKDQGRIFLTDLHSTNGTWINGCRLFPGRAYEIFGEEVLQIADLSFTISLGESGLAQSV